MAKPELNPALENVSGKIGGYVYRKLADGSVRLAKRPRFDPTRERTEPQQAQMRRFKQAAMRCTRLLDDPDIRAAYEQVVLRRGPLARLRATVMGDIMSPPEITTLDGVAYRGQVNNMVLIAVEDSVGVARVVIALHDLTTNMPVETAEKAYTLYTIKPSVEWLYRTSSVVPVGHAVEIRVTAYDLAGNVAESSQTVQVE